MAKEFTDIEITFCGKKCHFNRVANKDLTSFADKAEKEYDEIVKTWTDKSDDLVFEGEKIQKEIERKERRLEILQMAETKDVEAMLDIEDELEELDKKLNKVTVKIRKHRDDSPINNYAKIIDKTLGEKAEMLLDNITAKEYADIGTTRDTVIARNLEKYYQMAMMGDRYKKIEVEIDDDMDRFLKEQQELRDGE